jgi:hypothetical protein
LIRKTTKYALVNSFQQLQSFAFAAKLLFNSAQFHTLLHLLLTSVNLISGNFNAQLVKGFHPSRIGAICAFRFPNGDTLLEVLAQIVRKSFPELLSFTGKHCNAVGEAAKGGRIPLGNLQ